MIYTVDGSLVINGLGTLALNKFKGPGGKNNNLRSGLARSRHEQQMNVLYRKLLSDSELMMMVV